MSDTAGYELQWVTEQLAVGHAPLSMGQLASLKDQGITAILNLCGEFDELHRIQAEYGFEVFYLPVEDEETPELQELERALSWLDESIYLGKKVLIHCRYGIGRTGTVLNAYFLRRGFGHKMAAKKLKGLRSKPANFTQWRTIRKYGKDAGKLSVREPSLEFKNVVDLGPYFQEYEAMVAETEEKLSSMGSPQRCGCEHARCCETPVPLTLVEAVYMTRRINTSLSSGERQSLIERAVETARKERARVSELHSQQPFCLTVSGALCPLSEEGVCRLFDNRPLQCRTFELAEDVKSSLWNEMLHPFLNRISQELFLVFSDQPAPNAPLVFNLPDVVSGRYVQKFFHLLRQEGRNYEV